MNNIDRELTQRRIAIAKRLLHLADEFHHLAASFPDQVVHLLRDPFGEIESLVEICSQLLADGIAIDLFTGDKYFAVRRVYGENVSLPPEERVPLFRVAVKASDESYPWTVCEELREAANEDACNLAMTCGLSRNEYDELVWGPKSPLDVRQSPKADGEKRELDKAVVVPLNTQAGGGQKTGNPAVVPVPDPSEPSSPTAMQPPAENRAAKPPLKRPPAIAFRAWFTRDAMAMTSAEPTQQQIADKMTENGSPATQGQVSRWLAVVTAYLADGGVLSPVPELDSIDTVDPDVIDMGARQDCLTPRQRLRCDPNTDSDGE